MDECPLRLDDDAVQVLDADEEVFLLYADLNSESASGRGLGQVDSHSNVLSVDIELIPPARQSDVAARPKKTVVRQPKTISLNIAQDVTALRSRSGDTGSVVWKASIDLAQLLLQQLHYSLPDESLFDKQALSQMTALELGAGTGILGLAIHSFFDKYILTDIEAMQHLLNKNVALNGSSTSNISVTDLDWVALLSTPPSLRSRAFEFPPLDVILSVDCVYHPSLMKAFVETLDYLAIPNRTTVVVAIELRDEDAVATMLEMWLAKENWRIWRLGRKDALQRPYVMWAARKVVQVLVQ